MSCDLSDATPPPVLVGRVAICRVHRRRPRPAWRAPKISLGFWIRQWEVAGDIDGIVPGKMGGAKVGAISSKRACALAAGGWFGRNKIAERQ